MNAMASRAAGLFGNLLLKTLGAILSSLLGHISVFNVFAVVGTRLNLLLLLCEFERKICINVSLNCLLMVQYNMKLIPLFIKARLSTKSPKGP